MEFAEYGSVEIISRELIKPSSPTPDHLKTLKLSLLDQLSPQCYISLIFFYEPGELNNTATAATTTTTTTTTTTDDHVGICHHLKTSLSKTLTHYYPLAGKVDPDNFAIDCDDTGAEVVEARVHARLRDIIDDPDISQFEKYLPLDPLCGVYVGQGTLFMAQINCFDCGGFAVAISLAHTIIDSWSFLELMNAWAAISRGQSPYAPQFGVFTSHFPVRDLSETNITPSLLIGSDRLVTKRFVFDQEKFAALKQAGRSESVENPTRVEVISAFIVKYFEEKMKLKYPEKRLLAAHAVNIRPRASPSLGVENAFGNGIFLSVAPSAECGGAPPEIPGHVSRLRRGIRRVDDEYIRKSHSGGVGDHGSYLSDLDELCSSVVEGGSELFLFSSWSRFPTYEVDFGWGRPVWVCTTPLKSNHTAILMSAKCEEGIEAWISLFPENVEGLENEFKLIGVTN